MRSSLRSVEELVLKQGFSRCSRRGYAAFIQDLTDYTAENPCIFFPKSP